MVFTFSSFFLAKGVHKSLKNTDVAGIFRKKKKKKSKNEPSSHPLPHPTQTHKKRETKKKTETTKNRLFFSGHFFKEKVITKKNNVFEQLICMYVSLRRNNNDRQGRDEDDK